MKNFFTKSKIFFYLFIFLLIVILLFFLIFFKETQNNKNESQNNSLENISNVEENYNSAEIKILSGFVRPFGINVNLNKEIYLVDFGGHNLLIYDKNYNLIKNINPGIEILNSPHSIDFDSDGNIYITDFLNKKVQKFSKEGIFLKTIIDEKYLSGPATSYFDSDGNILVSDYGSNSLLKFNSNGSFLGWIGAKSDGTFTNGWEKNFEQRKISSEVGGFDRLHCALDDSDGNIYVADTWNHRIQKFSKDGKFIGWIGAKSDGTFTNGWEKSGFSIASSKEGGFDAPVALDISENDEIFIFEFNNGRVQKFSKDGVFLEVITTGFNQGYDIKIKDNILYIVNTGNKEVQIISLR